MTKLTFKFRPQKMSRKHRVKYQGSNWQSRYPCYQTVAKRPLNEQVLGRIFSILHTHLGHGLDKPRHRWAQAGIRMNARYPKRASCRYYNTWSLGAFI